MRKYVACANALQMPVLLGEFLLNRSTDGAPERRASPPGHHGARRARRPSLHRLFFDHPGGRTTRQIRFTRARPDPEPAPAEALGS